MNQHASKPRYIVIPTLPPTQRDWERFGLEYFEKRGYSVSAIDVSKLVMTNWHHVQPATDSPKQRRIEVAETWADLEKILASISRNDFVMVDVLFDKKSYMLFSLLEKMNIRYGLMTVRIPFYIRFYFLGSKGNLAERLLYLLKDTRIILLRALRKSPFSGIGRLARSLKGPTFWFRSGALSRYAEWPWPAVCRPANIPVHSADYELALFGLGSCDSIDVENRFAVFLENGQTDHPDFALAGMPTSASEGRYYRAINDFFDEVERRWDLPVVVACHPRADAATLMKKYDGRRVIGGRTAQLVKSASLVFAHDTTALSFAVIFRKPILILSSAEIERSFIKSRLVRIASALGIRRIMIDEPVGHDLDTPPKVDEARWRAVERDFIKSPLSKEQSYWRTVEAVVNGDYAVSGAAQP